MEVPATDSLSDTNCLFFFCFFFFVLLKSFRLLVFFLLYLPMLLVCCCCFSFNNSNNNSYIVVYPKMSSWHCTISKVPRDNWYKNKEKQISKLYCVYLQSTSKRKQQRWTDKDTTTKLQHSKPLTLKTKSKTVFFHSFYKHTNYIANIVQYTHTGWNLILLKGGEEEVCF